MTNDQSNPNSQNPKHNYIIFGHWGLGLDWTLGFGHWDLKNID